jgi:hypothetical protein
MGGLRGRCWDCDPNGGGGWRGWRSFGGIGCDPKRTYNALQSLPTVRPQTTLKAPGKPTKLQSAPFDNPVGHKSSWPHSPDNRNGRPPVWFRRGRLLIVSPDSRGTACPLSGRNPTYRPVQISEAGLCNTGANLCRFEDLPGGGPRLQRLAVPIHQRWCDSPSIGSRSHRRRWTARPNLGKRWPSWLLAM